MKKTDEGKYNEEKVSKVYEMVKAKLNRHELSILCDKLVVDKHVMIKTAELIQMDWQEQISK